MTWHVDWLLSIKTKTFSNYTFHRQILTYMKTKNNLFSSQEGYLIAGLVSIMGIALLPLILGIPLSFAFAVSYWATVIILAIALAALILVQQTREIKKSEGQIKLFENAVKNMKKTKEADIEA
jgi:hypothetical protein